ncbi:hypothetical protein CB1_001108037 [Camelus ferus]|nr:hypothetical protein CB1_001108037 [Camelus ferus]
MGKAAAARLQAVRSSMVQKAEPPTRNSRSPQIQAPGSTNPRPGSDSSSHSPEPLGPFPAHQLRPLPSSRAPAILSGWRLGLYFPNLRTPQMPVAVGPYGQSQPSCFDRVKMGFVMGCAVGMAAGALFGTFSCLRIGMRGRELMGGIGKTMMQSGGTFGTFMAIGMGIRC